MTSANAKTGNYIIIGAGSAGCVLANRLSADPRHKVILIEAGGDDRPWQNPKQFFTNMMLHIPAGIMVTLKHRRVNWMYETAPDAGTKNRRHAWPRGKVLGGSSSLNGLFYIRGQHADYDHWGQLGCTGWTASDVLPYFIRAEDQQRGADAFHGVGGPLAVTDMEFQSPVADALIAACTATGLPYNQDFNGATQHGVGRFQITARAGRRCSTSVAYLHPVLHRPNLQIITNALASRVLFDGLRATGVEYVQGGETRQAYATNEVILSGGAINSPQLLELSGIGSAAHLRERGIALRVDNPQVGENLQDHFMLGLQWRLKPGTRSVNQLSHGLKLAGEIAKYLLTRKGLLAYAVAQSAAFAKSRPELDEPDIQYHIMPASMDVERLYRTGTVVLEKLPGLTISPCQLRPESRGSIHVQSPDFRAHPLIIPNYLSHRTDQEVLVASIRLAREIAAAAPLAAFVERASAPSAAAQSDAELLDYARDAGGPGYHPVGTCRMGSGPDSVLDPQLRVRGVEGLRVADASVMPRLTSGNTNAPTIMIAEKAADMILAAAA